jgi:hypothetical protein
MSDDRHDAFSDVINILAAPIAGGIRTVEQLRRGADEMIKAFENLNRTMDNLNEAATRINALMAELEGPIKAAMPQLTRTIQTADSITQAMEGPIRKAAPNIVRITDTLSSPGFATLPTQLGDMLQMVGDVSKRLGPLTQFAENAGGLFGGLRIPGMGGSRPSNPSPRSEPLVRRPEPSPEPRFADAPAKNAPAKKAPAKKAPAKKTAGKAPVKKTAGKKAPAKKAPATKASGRY